jgi:splicing factor 3A subunit 1
MDGIKCVNRVKIKKYSSSGHPSPLSTIPCPQTSSIAMSLSLPKPVNTYAGENELRTNGSASNGNGNGQAEEDVGEYKAPRMSDRYKESMIYPPKEMRSESYPSFVSCQGTLTDNIAVIDKTSNHVSKSPSPALLEAKIKEQLKTDPKFAFLNDEDPYHNYYKYMVEKIREDAEDVAKGLMPAPTAGAAATGAAGEADDQVKNLADQVTAYEPKELEFKVDLPGVTAQDL